MLPHRKSEQDAEVAFHGRRVAFSGAGFDKLDVQCGGAFEDFKLENKYTVRGSFSLNKAYLKECERLARIELKKCFMRIDFDGKPYIVMREDWFKELVDG